MQFRTQIPVSRIDSLINYHSKIVSLGSCFAVNMAQKFDYFKFSAASNPFGILFHPVALENFIRFSLEEKEFNDTDVFFHNDLWHCFDAHSELSHPDKEILLHNLNALLFQTRQNIRKASHIIITLGTAWVYRSLNTNNLVANCHKLPQKQFSKELLSIQKITESLNTILSLLENHNPDVTIIFTISPVRHIKDGFIENQRSKAHLTAALHDIVENHKNHYYFPSYEIVMDELRDYRFYKEDMLHPNQTAIDYIWQRFSEACIATETQAIMREVDTIQKGLNHRPFNPESRKHLDFLSKLQEKISELQKLYPEIIF